jgi:phage terminase small subunit
VSRAVPNRRLSVHQAVELACPRMVSKPARRWFKHFAAGLAQRASVTVLDAAGLIELSEIMADVESLRAAVATHGHVYECVTVTGGRMVRARPEVSMLADSSRRLKSFLDSYGLTPASREAAGNG